MQSQLEFSTVVTKDGKWYVALCPELDIASQGKSIEDALKNLKEAVELYLEAALVDHLLAGNYDV